MKLLIALFATCTLGACGGGSDAPAPVAPKPVPAQSPAKVVFIGDSITEAWDVDSIVPGAINLGVNGNGTAQMLARLQRDMLPLHPDIIVILGGTNDLPGATVANPINIWSMVQTAQAAGCKVIVGTLLPTTHPARPDYLIRDFNAQLRIGAAQYGYKIADYYPALLLPDGSIDLTLFYDGLHPDAAGYETMWRVLEPVLESVQ